MTRKLGYVCHVGDSDPKQTGGTTDELPTLRKGSHATDATENQAAQASKTLVDGQTASIEPPTQKKPPAAAKTIPESARPTTPAFHPQGDPPPRRPQPTAIEQAAPPQQQAVPALPPHAAPPQQQPVHPAPLPAHAGNSRLVATIAVAALSVGALLGAAIYWWNKREAQPSNSPREPAHATSTLPDSPTRSAATFHPSTALPAGTHREPGTPTTPKPTVTSQGSGSLRPPVPPSAFAIPSALPTFLPTALPTAIPTALPSGWLPK